MDLASLKHKVSIPRSPFSLRLDNHRVYAYLCRDKPVDWTLDKESFLELVESLKQAGLQRVEVESLFRAMPNVLKGEPFLVAQGQPPEHGRNGEIQCHFETNAIEKIWEADEGEKVDFRERREINEIEEGALLAEAIPPTPGRDGWNVFGKHIAARAGRPVRVIQGRNVRIKGPGAQAFAARAGSAKLVGRKISVDSVRLIQGNVDFHTGNVRFNGDVVIFGDVLETFSIEAEGSIHVSGNVERADLRAGGDITIEGGVYGKEEIAVLAEGSLYLGFAENADLGAGENICVQTALVNCRTEARGKLFLKAVGKSLIGGHATAWQGVEAFCLGNPRLPTRTIVEFGVRTELPRRVRQLTTELSGADEERRAEIQDEIDALNEEYEKQRRAQVIVRLDTYPGLILKNGQAQYEARSAIRSMVYYKLEGKNDISMRAWESRAKARRAAAEM
ncbi:DUF342 domain-containing protein [bacterium]|nr:DUF342 domain-containing protein [bacterium]